jgi:lipid-A-disaccharide synthase-like uncharacterized protein
VPDRHTVGVAAILIDRIHNRAQTTSAGFVRLQTILSVILAVSLFSQAAREGSVLPQIFLWMSLVGGVAFTANFLFFAAVWRYQKHGRKVRPEY